MVFSVASLLIQLRPGEKRQRGRWRPGWGHQEGPGRGFLFLLAKMSQDSVEGLPRCIGHGVLVLDTCDDFYRPAAVAADFDVYVEYSLESLGPGHSSMALGRCPCFRN